MSKRQYPFPPNQNAPQSAELQVAMEAIASLKKRVEDLAPLKNKVEELETKGTKINKYYFIHIKIPKENIPFSLNDLDKTKTATIERCMSRIESQRKQINMLFAITNQMRAFCIRTVPGTGNQNKHWGRGK